MTDRPGPRRELERIRESGGPGSAHSRAALGAGPLPDRLRAAIIALASARGEGSSTCPSDAARALADEWRPLLPQARESARELARAGEVRLTHGDRVLDPDGDTSCIGAQRRPEPAGAMGSWHGSVNVHQRCDSGSAAMRAWSASWSSPMYS
ncbi:DUF3253 domain-containing protein [Amycolatopsis sp. NPDC051045]|uniref:DUF3253 domain-containing protein n=1 Tax=Amycolatopsis sp. NPDC051045 TaxID=3156922 RepID=UPI00343F4296